MSLIEQIDYEKMDIIGDIHGEYDALLNLLSVLGYDRQGNHKEHRKLIFVGDFCDRGPLTPSVIRLVHHLIQNGNAKAVLGNHELNLIRNKPKDGNGWFFEERELLDKKYLPYEKVQDEDREFIRHFMLHLPLAIEHPEMNIVHAVWSEDAINKLRTYQLGQIIQAYDDFEHAIQEEVRTTGLLERYKAEQRQWRDYLSDSKAKVPMLEASADYQVIQQVNNPIRLLTSGVEVKVEKPFYIHGRWRFAQREDWWNNYQGEKPVIVGHFWRKIYKDKNAETDENLFHKIHSFSWHGNKNNVFCIDYSVGGRFVERNMNWTLGEKTALAALRWPENEIVLDNGQKYQTKNFKKNSMQSFFQLKNKF